MKNNIGEHDEHETKVTAYVGGRGSPSVNLAALHQKPLGAIRGRPRPLRYENQGITLARSQCRNAEMFACDAVAQVVDGIHGRVLSGFEVYGRSKIAHTSCRPGIKLLR